MWSKFSDQVINSIHKTTERSKDYGKEDVNNKLSGETVERPLGIPKGDACHSKNHDGVTQQIDNRFGAFETDNVMLSQVAAEVHKARQAEDVAYKRFSGKDFASDDLKKEDRLEDQYMSTIRAILNGLTLLPETEPMRRKAEVAVQVFKDFQFSTNDGFEAEARKTFNMVQEWTGNAKYDLAGLGIQKWVTKAQQQAGKVLTLIQQRVDNESAKVKGELADARKATDAAIRKAFDIVNAMAVLEPRRADTTHPDAVRH